MCLQDLWSCRRTLNVEYIGHTVEGRRYYGWGAMWRIFEKWSFLKIRPKKSVCSNPLECTPVHPHVQGLSHDVNIRSFQRPVFAQFGSQWRYPQKFKNSPKFGGWPQGAKFFTDGRGHQGLQAHQIWWVYMPPFWRQNFSKFRLWTHISPKPRDRSYSSSSRICLK
jgi:hypothetical protein